MAKVDRQKRKWTGKSGRAKVDGQKGRRGQAPPQRRDRPAQRRDRPGERGWQRNRTSQPAPAGPQWERPASLGIHGQSRGAGLSQAAGFRPLLEVSPSPPANRDMSQVPASDAGGGTGPEARPERSFPGKTGRLGGPLNEKSHRKRWLIFVASIFDHSKPVRLTPTGAILFPEQESSAP